LGIECTLGIEGAFRDWPSWKNTANRPSYVLVSTYGTPQIGDGATLASPCQFASGQSETNVGIPPVALVCAGGLYSPLICALTLRRIELACRAKCRRSAGTDCKR